MGCSDFVLFPMGQHFHSIISHPGFHFTLLLLHLDHSKTTTWWSWVYEKLKSHGSRNIFSNLTINGLGCRVFIGQYTVAMVRWVVDREYTSAATSEDVFNMEVFHIERGWIITNTLVSKSLVYQNNLVRHIFCSLHFYIKLSRPI